MNIPVCKMYMDDEIKKNVNAVLDSGQFINGPQSKAFEKEFAEYIGVKRGIAVTSGTSALFLVFMYLNIKPGDEVIVPSHTFIASISQAVFFGAKPIFVEVDPNTYVMDIEDVKRKITPKTRAIVAVHLYGHPVDMDPLMEITHKQNIVVIEDCAQSHGTRYKGKIVGSIGHFGCFSFFPSKIMSVAGDGGMIVTNDINAADRLIMLKNHGRKDKYVHEIIGMNMRMPEIPAAIGRTELKLMPRFIQRRREIVKRYNDALSSYYEIKLPISASWADPVFYVYTIQIDNRDGLADFMKKKGVESGIYYPVPLHMQPVIFDKIGFTSLPITEKLCKRILSPPLSPAMTDEEVEYVVKTIQEYCKKK